MVDIFSYALLTLFAISTILPFLNIIAKAISEDWAVISGKVSILPVGFQLDNIKYVITSRQFLNSFLISVIITVAGTFLALLMTGIAAYPLSKKHLPGIKAVLILYVFTMFFSGGMIPNYLLIKNLGLYNTLWSIILPGMISVFNMLIIKNYYESLPESLEESAKIDGASNTLILFKIIIPLSLPVFATITLFAAVTHWNDYFGPMLYINKTSLKPLQLYLRDVVMEVNDTTATAKSDDFLMHVAPEGVRAATIIASTVPILCVYPYLQKYFIKGILIGSVKG